jgi:hypothetical protein
VSSPNHGPLLQPGDSSWVRTCGDFHSHSLMIERDTLERQLAALIGDTAPGPVRFTPSLDLTSGSAAGWARLVRWFAGEIAAPDSLLTNPLIAEPLHEAVLFGPARRRRAPAPARDDRAVPSWGPRL